ncbi:MAG: GntR family transcriptional regulator [Anaerolineales bacterium]|nr:GntR family transcriptional regulator [Anaerolineales bacterium]
MSDEKLLNPKTVNQMKASSRLSDMAYNAIREAVITRRIQPSEWLREETLSQEMGISRVTIRDAFARLVADGLAVRVPYKGVRTLAITAEDAVDVYEMRMLLEGLAFELAAKNLTPEEIDEMKKLLPDTSPGKDLYSFERAREANREFHWIAINASGRRHLIRHLEQLWELSVTYTLLPSGDEKPGNIQSLDLDFHTAILEALELGNGKQARAILVEHLEQTLETLLPRLQYEPTEQELAD